MNRTRQQQPMMCRQRKQRPQQLVQLMQLQQLQALPLSTRASATVLMTALGCRSFTHIYKWLLRRVTQLCSNHQGASGSGWSSSRDLLTLLLLLLVLLLAALLVLQQQQQSLVVLVILLLPQVVVVRMV